MINKGIRLFSVHAFVREKAASFHYSLLFLFKLKAAIQDSTEQKKTEQKKTKLARVAAQSTVAVCLC